MKARTSSFVVLGFLLLPVAASAEEQLQLPQASPKARVEQRVGITDFSLDYSSPGVKGRKIWGDLVPWDKAWRAGANASTTLKASTDFKLGTTTVKAGAYSIFMIPNEKQWTVILNADTNAGGNHDPKKDVAQIAITPAKLAGPRERLTFLFTDSTDDQTNLELEWETVRIRVPLSVETKSLVNAAIDKTLAETWRPHFQSANYLFQAGDHKRALAYVKQSIAIKATFRNEWLHAQLLQKAGKKAEAKAAANRALKLGPGDPVFESFFKGEITKQVKTWK
jgi:hypothetical protein